MRPKQATALVKKLVANTGVTSDQKEMGGGHRVLPGAIYVPRPQSEFAKQCG